jgi:ABC-type sugar transport system substrate-binding protein
VALTGWGLGGVRGTGAAVLLAAAGLLVVRLVGRIDAERAAAACTALLAGLGDLHGVSLASGAAAMVLVRAVRAGQRTRRSPDVAG